ncbi:diguanylate phosphodiesterase [Loktanella sp. 3ANDIMAR09]|uniref:EAL domain-containing protein n=1 Tax=Loktanella sp. 3ANDIMAR09 TaxID=1225657 RepID=UPI0006FFA7FE|nr:EAL domain-containing protein [Loktanella sp. 3ANDIMAR09]KQI67930.1 diguanylate phosphodiesterase [Loktanella sp. 3ANDIMAR09]
MLAIIDADGGVPEFSDPLMAAFASRDADIQTLVSEALDAGRARLAFQPVVSATTDRRVCFYEGLIRLLDDGGRVLPAAQFMPQVADTDVGRRIDTLALKLSLRLLADTPHARLSINVSARSLADWRWRSTMADALAARGNLGDRLILEISEQSAMLLHEVVIRFMIEMQPRGVCFALDGFGGGLTSFLHLRDFYFDLAKVHKGFTAQLAQHPENQVLVEALTNVARQFEMFVVAEGVESERDAQILTRIGVDCLQGYHTGVPNFRLV